MEPSSRVPECVICQEIFYEPVTLPCGHSFCRSCIRQSLRVKPLCPSCRTPMIGSVEGMSLNFTLIHILETQFRNEYELKRSQILSKNNNDSAEKRKLQGKLKNPDSFENSLVLKLRQFRYLFPLTTQIIEIDFDGPLESIISLCPDKTAVI